MVLNFENVVRSASLYFGEVTNDRYRVEEEKIENVRP
jgi:hypothetical protein